MNIAERIKARIKVSESGCWLWEGATEKGGYGLMKRGAGLNHGMVHRLAYEAWRGPIPEGLQIDHLCRVRNCVNPDHLEAVTPRQNVMRGRTPAAANAAKTHCPRGHEYSVQNTRRGSKGERCCRACDRDRARTSYARAKAARQ